MREKISDKQVIVGINPTAVSSDTTTAGAIIDARDCDALTFIILVSTFTDGVYTPLVNESDDSGMSGETATADADLYSPGSGAAEANAALSAAGDSMISYLGIKSYVTCDIVSTGTTTGATVTVLAVKERLRIAPEGS